MAIHIELDISPVTLAYIVLGVFICLIGQVSYVVKERLYLSAPLLCVLVGIAMGPPAARLVDPYSWCNVEDYAWTGNNTETLIDFIYEVTRIVVGIQVTFAGIDLPAAYLWHNWKSMAFLLLPVMTFAWFMCAALIYALIPNTPFIEALVVSACITPTDPVLANSIVKGRFADKHVSTAVRNVVSAESGANDGLGYPFLFLPMLLLIDRSEGQNNIGLTIGEWIVQVWIYEVLMACVIGAVIGTLARYTLVYSHKYHLIDHESFLAFGVGLTFISLGIIGILGSDDLLGAFVAGNALTWRDFYRVENESDHTQDVLDNLINTATFILVGALVPWLDYADSAIPLTPWRMVVLFLLVLLLRRLPIMVALYKFIPALANLKEALFVGYFGPIGVSGLYYAMVAMRELPEEREHLRQIVAPIVIFMGFGSIVAHGISIPLAKHGPKITNIHRAGPAIKAKFVKEKEKREESNGAANGHRHHSAHDVLVMRNGELVVESSDQAEREAPPSPNGTAGEHEPPEAARTAKHTNEMV